MDTMCRVRQVMDLMRWNDNNKTKVAKILGVRRQNLHKMIKGYEENGQIAEYNKMLDFEQACKDGKAMDLLAFGSNGYLIGFKEDLVNGVKDIEMSIANELTNRIIGPYQQGWDTMEEGCIQDNNGCKIMWDIV